MNRIALGLLAVSILYSFNIHAQKLKRADRTIVSNMLAHTTFLTGDQVKNRVTGSNGEKLATEYISKHFANSGLKPKGDSNSWFQSFSIYDGKAVLQDTRLSINGKQLQLFSEYFPFPFSAEKNAEAAVAIALAEDGVPWFKDLREFTEMEDSSKVDTLDVIRGKARTAADKGATALIIYNSAEGADLTFDKFDSSHTLSIPVIFITHEAFKKYCSDESAILDVSLNVDLESSYRKGINVIGYADNSGDSTVITGAHIDDDTGIAALMEVARLLRPGRAKNKNYLFVAYYGDTTGSWGSTYFKQHFPVDPERVEFALDVDTVNVSNDNLKTLHLVKRSLELIRNN